MLGHFSGVPVLFLLLLVLLLLSALLLVSSDATCNTAGRYTDQLFILQGENGGDSFSKLPFSRLNRFCCQVIHFTFCFLSLSYVVFLQFGEEWDKTPFVFGQEETPDLDYNICLSQSHFFEIFVWPAFPRKSISKPLGLIENIFPPIPLILIRLEVSLADLHTASSSVLFSPNPTVLAEAKQPYAKVSGNFAQVKTKVCMIWQLHSRRRENKPKNTFCPKKGLWSIIIL